MAALAIATLIKNLDPLLALLRRVGGLTARTLRFPMGADAIRVERRRQFAKHLELQLTLLAASEDWHDRRFAELEAEVEIEGGRRWLPWTSHTGSADVSLRREKSLSKALEKTNEPLVILEGEPGAGKSVALRHLAQRLARQSATSRYVKTIPLYVNLKDFRPEQRPITSEMIRDFILESLRKVNDRDVDRFLEEEFQKGLEDGSWLFLLDSFDEIPEILSTGQSSETLREYANAFYTFLLGMRQCRSVVASREFHGIASFKFPTFRIVRLAVRQQADLIRRSGLTKAQQDIMLDGLRTADSDVQQLARNPMSLGLLCEYLSANDHFPSNAYSTFESYLSKRLQNDQVRIHNRYGVEHTYLRALTEEIAFLMADVPGLGLNPHRADLRMAVLAANRFSAGQLENVLDALEYAKLARREGDAANPTFTFMHRRFQEYFATCVVLRNLDRVSPLALLTEGQWRETAVVLMQTQESTAAIFEVADELLNEMIQSQEANVSDVWAPHSLHLIEILKAVASRNSAGIPESVRVKVGSLLKIALDRGRRNDWKWVIECAIAAEEPTTIELVEFGFSAQSAILRAAAFEAVGRLAAPERFYQQMRMMLVEMSMSGFLQKNRPQVLAQIARLADPVTLRATVRLLLIAPWLGVVFFQLSIWAATIVGMSQTNSVSAALGTGALGLFLGFPAGALGYWGYRTSFRMPVKSADSDSLDSTVFTPIRESILLMLLAVFWSTLSLSLLGSEDSYIAAIPLVLGFVWPIGARHAVETGRWLALQQIPFLFLYSTAYFMGRLNSRKKLLSILIPVAVIAPTIALFYFLSGLLSSHAIWILGSVGVIFSVTMFGFMVWDLTGSLLEIRRDVNAVKLLSSSSSPNEVLSVFSSLLTPKGVRLWLDRVAHRPEFFSLLSDIVAMNDRGGNLSSHKIEFDSRSVDLPSSLRLGMMEEGLADKISRMVEEFDRGRAAGPRPKGVASS